MTFIVTALHCEAAPLIDYWRLRRQVHHRAFQVFRGESSTGPIDLIVTGVGKMRSAIGTAALCAGSPHLTPLILNLGVCAAPVTHPLGEIYYVHRIRDHATARNYLPDAVIAHSFIETHLTTFDAPVIAAPTEPEDSALVDMEGSGFAEAASIYTAPSAWSILKVVSDHFSPPQLTKEGISQLIAPHCGAIDGYLTALAAAHSGEKFSFPPDDKAILDQFLSAYRFTASQKQMLTTAAREYVLRTGEELTALKRFLHREPSSKAELKAIFEEAHRALAHP